MASRLKTIFNGVTELIEEFNIDCMAIEGLFSHARVVKTAMMMTHARAIPILVAGIRELPIFEYQPTTVKSVVVGSGHAAKPQIKLAVQSHLGTAAVKNEHTADAFAIALCHILTNAKSGGTIATILRPNNL